MKFKYAGEGDGSIENPFKIPFNTKLDQPSKVQGELVLDSSHGLPNINLFTVGFNSEKGGVSLELGEPVLNEMGTTCRVPVTLKGLEHFKQEPRPLFIKAIKYASKHPDTGLQNSKTLLDPDHTVEDGWSGNEYWFVTYGQDVKATLGPCPLNLEVLLDIVDSILGEDGKTLTIPHRRMATAKTKALTENGSGEVYVNYSTSPGMAVQAVGPSIFALDPTLLGRQVLTFTSFARWNVPNGEGLPYTDILSNKKVFVFNVLSEQDFEKLKKQQSTPKESVETPAADPIEENPELTKQEQDLAFCVKMVKQLAKRVKELEKLLPNK